MPAPEEMSRDELIELARRQDTQISSKASRVSELLEVNEALEGEHARQIAELTATNNDLAARLAKLEHLLSRNSGNSSMPPSKDDDLGRTPPPAKPKRGAGPKRKRGKQPGAPGANLAWVDKPDDQVDRFPQGWCECGHDLAEATDLGIVDRYQQHEIPQISVSITQYDQHQVRCGCGQVHTAARPDGARAGVVGYGPNLQSFAVYLMVVHFVPAQRCVELLESLTGAAPQRTIQPHPSHSPSGRRDPAHAAVLAAPLATIGARTAAMVAQPGAGRSPAQVRDRIPATIRTIRDYSGGRPPQPRKCRELKLLEPSKTIKHVAGAPRRSATAHSRLNEPDSSRSFGCQQWSSRGYRTTRDQPTDKTTTRRRSTLQPRSTVRIVIGSVS